MKRLLLLPLFLALTCCASLARKDGDSFEASGHSPEQFERDNAACNTLATDQVVNNWAKSFDTDYGQNRAFNAVYSRCMAERHYRARAYYENWLPG